MGKPTGFLEFERTNNPAQEPRERIKNFREFHQELSEKERKEQGARCMACGVPFCQSAMRLNGMVSGCPLHNLIPEWNDEVYQGHMEHALSRLTKTSSFPEFTSRVCPALCEAACSCGLYGNPVTVRENEYSIIEYGFRHGLMKPRKKNVSTGKKVAVIGAGPAGLAVADRLNMRGHEVTVFEREDRPGGLMMYGIPNMKLEKEIIERRIALMEAEGIKFVLNADIGKNISAEEIMAEYDAVVLCCGAKHARDLTVPGRDAEGVYFAVDFLSSTTRALKDGIPQGDYISAEGKQVVIVGGGDTGNDCVGTCIRHGCAKVTQIEMMPCLPRKRAASNPWPQWPRICKTDYGQQEAIAVFGSDPRIYETTVKELLKDEQGKLKAVRIVKVAFEKEEKTGRMAMRELAGTEQELPADMLLIAAGFLGAESYTLQAFGVEANERSNVKTQAEKYATNVNKVFTAGDMHRGQSLVVWAIAEGRAAAKEVDEFLMGYTNMV